MLVNHRKTIKFLIKISKRTMFTTRNIANKAVNMNLIRPSTRIQGSCLTNKITNNTSPTIQQRSAVYTAYKYKSPIAKNYATDNSGKHVMQNKTVCADTNCDNKTCQKPCDKIICSDTLGHYTHYPPNNSTNEYLTAYDIQGQLHDQFFVKPQNKSTMSADDLKNLTEDDMVIDHKATNYFNTVQGVFDKVTK